MCRAVQAHRGSVVSDLSEELVEQPSRFGCGGREAQIAPYVSVRFTPLCAFYAFLEELPVKERLGGRIYSAQMSASVDCAFGNALSGRVEVLDICEEGCDG